MRKSPVRSFVLFGLSAILLTQAAVAQTTPGSPFNIRLQQATTVSNLADQSTIAMQADAIGLPTSATVTLTYKGTTSVQVNNVDFTGSTDFALSGVPDQPFTVNPNQAFAMVVVYKPTSSVPNIGRITLSYVENKVNGTSTLNLTGVAPEFVFSYMPQGGNQTVVASGGAVVFPQTPVTTTSSTTMVLTNRGSGPGVVKAISLSAGPEFQLAGLPLAQTSVDAGKDLRFTVAFTPKQLQPTAGTLAVDLASGRATFNVQGSGSGPQFAYESVADTTFSALLPNQLINVPDAVVGNTSSIVVRVRNTGNADAKIPTISILGAGFTLSDVPFLPATLTVGSAATMTVTFTPTQPGRATGRLRIGDDMFDVAANGLGPTLAYSYAVGSVTTTVQGNGSVIFTPVSVGATSTMQFIVNNTGTAPTSIGSISVAGTGKVFTLAGLPALPTTVQPGSTLGFTVTFAPTVQGASTATLQLDTVSFTLSGNGNPPAALPDYKIEGASGSVEPQTQLGVGLTLSDTYPLPLKGTLTLGFNSEAFVVDPAVQFATGGRTATFIIPANSKSAQFNGTTQTQVRLQTGTVAGMVTLTPSFQTQDGATDLTPVNPTGLTFSIPSQAPRLLNVQVSSKTATGITLLVTGYATSRSITQMDFTFTPVSGENVQTTKVTLSAVEPSFQAWYSSTTSQQYGSQFTATIPFTLNGDVKNVSNPTDTVQSVSVTLTNRTGTSQARSLDLK